MTFVENAEQLGIDPSKVDFAVISHGHGDHGGALSRFLNLNEEALVYVREETFKELAVKIDDRFKSAGITPEMCQVPQIKFVDESFEYFHL